MQFFANLFFPLEEASKSSDSQLNIASKSRLSRSSRSSKQKPGKLIIIIFILENKIQFSDKSKSLGNEPVIARKSQDVSNAIETEKTTTKKSIYLKAAEFLLKYNVATV